MQPSRLPFFYGWVVVAIAFLTMGIGVNSRTAFSLFFPQMLDEFGWDRSITAGAFSIGFMASIVSAPLTGILVDRYGPRVAIPLGASLVASGLVLATFAITPLHVYLSLGVLCVGGSVSISYIGHSSFLPNWFIARRGMAIGIAFSGVGVASIVLFPMLQATIDQEGWRHACWVLAGLIVVVILPLNALFQRRHPADIGLQPDGRVDLDNADNGERVDAIVDEAWANKDWTLGEAVRTSRYWWCALGYFGALYAWYAVQVHQTKVFIDLGFGAEHAAFALGLVGFSGIFGQIVIGYWSDRIGREWGWTLGCLGYVLCYLLLLKLHEGSSLWLAYGIAAAQGLLGYGIAPLFSSISAEIFQGRKFGVIVGTLSIASGVGAAIGPWFTGYLYDAHGNYDLAFSVALGAALVSAVGIWLAAPRKIRLVAGQAEKRHRLKAIKTTEAAGFRIRRGAPIPVTIGVPRRLSAQPLDHQGRPVVASLRYEWQLSQPVGRILPVNATASAVDLIIDQPTTELYLRIAVSGRSRSTAVEHSIRVGSPA